MTNKKAISLLVLIGLAVFLTVAPASADFQITTNTASQSSPAIDGSVVVYYDNRSGNSDLYSYDLSTNTETLIAINTSGQNGHDISGSIIVWQDFRNGNGDIYGYDLSTNLEFQITIDPDTQQHPSVSGSIVVWEDDRNGNADIYGYDLSTHTEFQITTDASVQQLPSVSGSTVVWDDRRNPFSSIYGYDLTTNTEFPINTYPSWKSNPKIGGSIVIWADSRNGYKGLYGYDLTTGTEFQVTLNNQVYTYATDGSKVVWLEVDNTNVDILGYDLTNQTLFTVTSDPYNQGSPDISGSIVVWEDSRNGNVDIYGFSFLVGDEPSTAFDVNTISPYYGSTLNTTGADITSGGANDFADMWHLFDPNQQPSPTGDYTISLCGSNFNTTLAVFDEQMTELAFNDDYCSEQSQLVVNGLQSGKKYYIRVSGVNGARGDYTLLIDGPAPQCVARPTADLNDDCIVNLLDLGVMASQWFACGYDLPQGCN